MFSLKKKSKLFNKSSSSVKNGYNVKALINTDATL